MLCSGLGVVILLFKVPNREVYRTCQPYESKKDRADKTTFSAAFAKFDRIILSANCSRNLTQF